MAKIGKRLMSVFGMAVTAVYAAGYIYTMPSAQANTSSIPGLNPTTPTPSQSTPGAAAKAYNSKPQSSTKKSSSSHHATSTTASKKSTPTHHAPSTAASTSSTAKKGNTKSSTSTNTAKKPAAKAAQYKDGVFTGVASNPYGGLSLAVTIAHGKIAAVKITSYTMHYPQSVIDPQLPQEAVQMQTWRIYIVSGATASTYNFAEAMYQALNKAKA
ncbi:FMN-binding protein [Ferroacidibacillus organovorans]|uniref:FMN-binding domain-containing protein n=1 Tax=Ferroacidibacillus organovorans TaxID=1765683 RepID=A0A853KFG4_9BACL|nr:hypothetical protein [Ferroacidibacillus organovorans]KYP81354.1 hypothetical protein AYJ22_00890 [Ferroacidibacillus organovorans]OAG95141.1 hypothetical protein AYW79_01490 [Ferroacidibacillus organovorans]